MGVLDTGGARRGSCGPADRILQRVLVYQTDEEAEMRALVNPRVVSSSEERETADEGCLSLGAAEVVVPVERPVAVTVAVVGADGEAGPGRG